MKTVASLNESNEAREQRFLNDVLRRARNLDAKYPGSSFEQTLMSYGQNGKYLVLVDGPFANLPMPSMPSLTFWLGFALFAKSVSEKQVLIGR